MCALKGSNNNNNNNKKNKNNNNKTILCIFLLLLLLALIPVSLAQDSESGKEDLSVILERARKHQAERKKTFALDESFANHSILRTELLERGWKEKTGLFNKRGYDFKWSWSWERLQVGNSHQIVNHFSSYDEVGTKEGLTRNLNFARKQSKELAKEIDSFFPRSYLLSEEEGQFLFRNDFERTLKEYSAKNNEIIVTTSEPSIFLSEPLPPLQPQLDGKDNIWIVKPSRQARGVGIELFNNINDLFEYSKTQDDQFVVQKYLENPFLILQRKFDIRQFVLVTSLDPLVIFLFQDCYLRFCSTEYTINNLEDRFIHLTNHQVQKDSKEFHSSPIPESQYSLSQFQQYLRENGYGEIWDTKIKPKIKALVITALRSWPRYGHRVNSFEMLGFDIVLNENLDPFLLEINVNPGTHLLTDIVKKHHPKVQKDLLQVVLDKQNVWRDPNFLPGSVTDDFGEWEMIYKGETFR